MPNQCHVAASCRVVPSRVYRQVHLEILTTDVLDKKYFVFGIWSCSLQPVSKAKPFLSDDLAVRYGMLHVMFSSDHAVCIFPPGRSHTEQFTVVFHSICKIYNRPN